MSDSDDTDLLLLIPPDFFLVNSSELDSLASDCELNLGPDHDELKDFVVNDLISQVNDLESRVCMIENLETSITICSTCNEDSLHNQSVNSLTESDILRVKNQDICGISPCGTLVRNRPSSFQPGVSFRLEKHLTNLDSNEFDGETPVKRSALESPSSFNFGNGYVKNYQSELLKEIDNFLSTKDNIHTIPESCKRKELSVDRNHSLEGFDCQLNLPLSSTNVLTLAECSENNLGDLSESLALPEVYSLLREMEETQYEIEKKLRFRDLVLKQTQDNKDASDSIARSTVRKEESNLLNSKATNFENIYSKSSMSSRPPFDNHNQVLLDRIKTASSQKQEKTEFSRPRSDSSTQVSYLFSPGTSVLYDDNFMHQNEAGQLLSPSKVGNDRNHMDIIMANLTRKSLRENVSEFIDRKDSPQKSTHFRRHLPFDKSFVSTRPKHSSRPNEQILRSSNKLIQRDDDSLKGRTDSLQQTNNDIRPNAPVENIISLPFQNSTEKFIEQQNLASGTEDKKSYDSLNLQEKLR